jgi:ABC-type transport system involved in multi-copper enzyme maturation permease subunit
MGTQFRQVLAFELRYQARTPILLLGALLFGLMAFGASTSDAVVVGEAIGNVHRNAPAVIVGFLSVFSVLGLFVAAAFMAGALLRDFELGTAELFFSTPLGKPAYVFGRFTAGLLVSLLVFAAVMLGLLLGSLMPWIDPQRLGPTTAWPYVYGLLVFVLPNMFFGGALLSALAVWTRSMLGVYLGVIAFFVLFAITDTLMADVESHWLAALIDPSGDGAVRVVTRYWSAAERNTLLPPLAGPLLVNRLMWLAVGVGLLALAYAYFKPERMGATRRFWRRAARPSEAAGASVPVAPAHSRHAVAALPKIQRAHGVAAQWLAFWRLLRLDLMDILGSVPFRAMLAFGLLNLTSSANSVDERFGTKVYPVTHLMLNAMDGSYNFLLVLIVAFYAGELVFRERQARLAEVSDALPVRDWVPACAKLAALTVVVLVFLGAGSLAAIGFQFWHGYHDVQPGLYLISALLTAWPFVLTAALALALHTLTQNKLVGHLLVVLYLVLRIAARPLHFEHNLYQYGSAPPPTYSDMNGFGHFLQAHLWFRGYWTLIAAALVLLAIGFWSRGQVPGWRARLGLARVRLRGLPGAALAALLLAAAGVGGWIFYNTNVLNRYEPQDRAMDRRADYERKYAYLERAARPRVRAAEAEVDIYPEQRAADVRGRYRLENATSQPLSELVMTFPPEAEVQGIDLAGADLQRVDARHGVRVYRLRAPLAPGTQFDLGFRVRFAARGFTNGSEAGRFHANGTFFDTGYAFPTLGYDSERQLIDRGERRRRGLGDVPRMPKLEDEAARADSYVSTDADWIDFSTTISTSPDQVALAPGYLQREWTSAGRRYFRYAMDAPMLPFAAYLSARWQVRRERWKDVPIEIYYDARHAYNVERMVRATQASLDYFTTHFTPYQHRQVRILEFPRYATFAQAFANTIPFSESIGFIADLRDPEAIDYVFYVTAHEVAHQWWAHQVIGARVQGATVLSESLAQYSALMVMERAYGRAHMRRFLRYELDRYLAGRGRELVEEQPLLRVENQPYIHYSKGSLVFYRLRDELGEEALNRALRRFLTDKGFRAAPYPTARELLEYIRVETPPDKQALLGELFEQIVFHDNRVLEAQATKRPDGRYDVELVLQAVKHRADGKGVEQPLPLDDWIEVGVFARAPGARESQERVLSLERHRITSQETRLHLTVAGEPYEAGFDPYNKMIDRVPADNRKRVSLR